MSLRKFLFENEAVRNINSPLDYLYIKLIRFTLVIVNAWPQKETGEIESRIYSILCNFLSFLMNIAHFVFSITYIINHKHVLNFLKIGHILIVILMSCVSMSRVLTLTYSRHYRQLAKEFLTKFHLFYYKDRSERAMETHKRVHLVSHLFTLWIIVQMLSGLTLFNVIPMYSNYASGKYSGAVSKNNTFEHSLYFSYPMDVSTEMTGYIIACIYHWIASYLCATWFCMYDLFLSLMVFHVWGHFKILINSLNNFQRPSSNLLLEDNPNLIVEKYTREELLKVSEQLIECINYHREIKKFTGTMSDVFGPMLFVYYMFHQASGCLLLLECSEMTAQALMRYLPLTIILTQQLIQLSVVFELVGSESAKLKDAVYNVPWEIMDPKNRKTVAFFLMNVQEPIHVKALGLADVGVTTMAAILRTSMSYFTFLRSTS